MLGGSQLLQKPASLFRAGILDHSRLKADLQKDGQ